MVQKQKQTLQKLRIGDLKKCAYQFIYDDKDKNDTLITQHFIMHGLGVFIKEDRYVECF